MSYGSRWGSVTQRRRTLSVGNDNGKHDYFLSRLVRRVGEEAAQAVNIAPMVWYQELTSTDTMTGHFRVLNPFAVAATATEATALPQLSWAPTGTTVSAGLDGFSVIESKVVNSIAPDVLDKIAMQGGTSLGRTVDSALAALFPSLTAGTVGTSGSALTLANILTAEANLDAVFAIGNRVGFVHPHAFANLKASILSTNYGVSRLTVDAQGNEQIEVGSVVLRKNALVPSINSNADFAGGIIVEEALGLVMAQKPQVEILPVPGSHAYSIDCTVAFGVGVIRPTFGVLIQSGKTA
jgi:hypothetical protein